MIDIAKDEMIELRDVARRFGRRYCTVMSWVKSGRLPANPDYL